MPPMPCWLGFGALAASLLLMQGCSSIRAAAGLEKRSPDEFAVVRRAPLIVPPDFALRPPTPGATRPNVETPRDQARATLTGRDASLQERTIPASEAAPATIPQASSEGEQALLTRTNSDQADPAVRSRINQESGAPVAVDEALFDRLMQEPTNGAASAQGGVAQPASAETAPMVIERRQRPLDLSSESAP